MIRSTTSASNMFRRELCPGSHAAEDGLPDSEDSEFSAEGTLLHRLDANPGEDRSTLTLEQHDVLQNAAEADIAIFREIHELVDIPEDEPFEQGNEKEMWFKPALKALFPGHCDRWRYYPRFRLAVIIDKKFGRIEVTPADSNLQLRCYALMAQRIWKAERIIVAINQPRMPFGQRITMAEYYPDSLTQANKHIQAIWTATLDANAKRVAGTEQCRYCKAKAGCPEFAAKFSFLAQPDAQTQLVQQIRDLSDNQIDQALQALKFADMVAPELKAEAHRRIQAGQLPMWEAEENAPMGKITDPVLAFQIIMSELKFESVEALECSGFSLGKLEEAYRRRTGMNAKDAKKAVRGALANVITTISKAATLKRRAA